MLCSPVSLFLSSNIFTGLNSRVCVLDKARKCCSSTNVYFGLLVFLWTFTLSHNLDDPLDMISCLQNRTQRFSQVSTCNRLERTFSRSVRIVTSLLSSVKNEWRCGFLKTQFFALVALLSVCLVFEGSRRQVTMVVMYFSKMIFMMRLCEEVSTSYFQACEWCSGTIITLNRGHFFILSLSAS